MENAAVDSKKRDQRKDHNKSNKGYHGYNKNKDKDRRDRDRVSISFFCPPNVRLSNLNCTESWSHWKAKF